MPPTGKGSGLFTDVKVLKEKVADHEKRLKDHGHRLDRHDTELVAVNNDLALLGDLCARSARRGRGLLLEMRRRARRAAKKRQR